MTTYFINNVLIFNHEQSTLCIQQKTINLDYKLSELLAFFIQHQGQVVSRDQILENVWPDTVVNDNTVNWSISQLRKALGDSATNAQFIKTIPKKGYQLIATISVHTEPEVSVSPQKQRKNRTFLLSISVLVLLAVGFIFNSNNNTKQPQEAKTTLTSMQPVTALDGMESSPILLSDQESLVFTYKSPSDATFQLRIQPLVEHAYFNVETNERKTELQNSQRMLSTKSLTNDHYDYRHLAAGKDEYTFFAVRLYHSDKNTERQCEIVMLTLTTGKDAIDQTQKLSDCHGDGWSKLAFHSKSNRLFYSDKSDDLYAVYSLDLASRQICQHSFPNNPGLGDHFINMDLAQNKLLILRDEQNVKTSFLVLDIASKNIEIALEIDDFYYSAYLAPNGDAIWHNWGNATVRHQPLNGDPAYDILTTNFGWNYNARPLLKDLAVFTVSDSNDGDLLTWDGKTITRQHSSVKEFLPTLSNDNYAFISKRSGMPQIWLQQKDKPLFQLSNLTDYQTFQDLSLSPNGRFIAGVSHQNMGLINLNDQSYRSLSNDEFFARNLSWSKNGATLYFSEYKNGQWQSFEMTLNSTNDNIQQLPISDAFLVREFEQDKLLYSQTQQKGLYLFDQSNNTIEKLLQEFPKETFWQLVDNQIYFIQQSPDSGLFSTPLDEYSPKLVISLPQNTLNRFSVNPKGNRFMFENVTRTQSDLKLAKINLAN